MTAALQLACNGSGGFDVSPRPVHGDGELNDRTPVFAVSSQSNRFGVGADVFVSEVKRKAEHVDVKGRL